MSLLITRPKYELVTHYLYVWSDVIIQEANKKNLRVFDLETAMAELHLCEVFNTEKCLRIVLLVFFDRYKITADKSNPLRK